MNDIDSHKNDIDETIKFLHSKIPSAELYELGAIFLSVGAFLVASAIPDLKAQLIPTANLAHQLLNQKENAEANPSSD